MKKTYTKKQITEAIAYWKKQLAKGNYRNVNEAFERSGENPYDIDNCKASGWVVFFMKNGSPYLPVDFSMNNNDPEDAAEVNRVRQQAVQQFHPYSAFLPNSEGVQMNASFFISATDAKRALDMTEIDSGGWGTNRYLYDCVDAGLIRDDEIGDFEFADDVKVIDTYVCGNNAVIFGRDALDDNADEWERENR